MTTFNIKRGSTSPGLKYQLGLYTLGANTLEGASVIFRMKHTILGTLAVEAPAEVTDNDGIVTYRWDVGDTAVAGKYRGEFEITFIDTAVEIDPSSGYIDIEITDSLD